jgi:uncharacterized protein (TIGR02147 family)
VSVPVGIYTRLVEKKVYQKLLESELSKRCEKNPRYSLRAFSRALKINDGALSQIISGKRIPSVKTAERIANELNLDPEVKHRFLKSCGTPKGPRAFEKLRTKPAALNVEYFKVISDWYHIALMEMTLIEGFEDDPVSIAKRLGISRIEAQLALSRLKELELIEEKDGQWVKTQLQLATPNRGVTTAALRIHQKQMLQKSIESLENDPIETRSHTGMTMAIDPMLLPEAREMIEAFSQSLCSFLESSDSKKVYQLSVNLFPLEKEKQ